MHITTPTVILRSASQLSAQVQRRHEAHKPSQLSKVKPMPQPPSALRSIMDAKFFVLR